MQSGKKERKQKKVELLLLGNCAVGKTSILRRFTNAPTAFQTYIPTVGIDLVKRTLILDDENEACVKLWDTAGQERFRTITRAVYQRCDGAMVVFDVCNRKSFLAVHDWIKHIEQNAPHCVAKCLVGNRADLLEREVSQDEARETAKELGVPYFETSAKLDRNVEETVTSLVQEVCNRNESTLEESAIINASLHRLSVEYNSLTKSEDSWCSC